MIFNMDFLREKITNQFQFLLEIGYKFLTIIENERNINFLFAKERTLVTIKYNISNEYIDIFILFDFNTIDTARNLYYNSISLKDIFVLKSIKSYDGIMPCNIGITKSIELVAESLKLYGIELLKRDRIVTTRDIFYKDKSPYGGQPYDASELKKIALFELSVKRK